jgi:cardiolipin synthase A/B
MKHTIGDNTIQLLRNGGEYFPALIAAIESADRFVWLETYIFANDSTGQSIADALEGAVSRGVEVRVVIDGFGSSTHLGELGERMKTRGVKLAVFRPETSRFRFRKSRLRRMHRKLVVVDDRLAFCGGINLIDDFNMHGYANAHEFGARYDYAVALEGPIVVPIKETMNAMFERVARGERREFETSVTRASLRALEEAARRTRGAFSRDPHRRTHARVSDASAPPTIRFVHRDNVNHRKSIEAGYIAAIGAARREVLIANAYFFPGRKLRKAMNDAELRGVRVRVLLQGRREYFLQHYATRALYDMLFNHGIEVAEYRASFLHAKVAVVDDRWATVGSSNIDPFSLLLAREANVFVEHEPFALELKASVDAAWNQDSNVIERSDWNRRPWFVRVKARVAYAIARFLLVVFGLGDKH